MQACEKAFFVSPFLEMDLSYEFQVTPPGAEIASVLVQARPERLAEVEAAILALAGCEIFERDPRGKLVVVIETSNASTIGSTLNTIALLPDVFTASLVFHAIDAG